MSHSHVPLTATVLTGNWGAGEKQEEGCDVGHGTQALGPLLRGGELPLPAVVTPSWSCAATLTEGTELLRAVPAGLLLRGLISRPRGSALWAEPLSAGQAWPCNCSKSLLLHPCPPHGSAPEL